MHAHTHGTEIGIPHMAPARMFMYIEPGTEKVCRLGQVCGAYKRKIAVQAIMTRKKWV